MPVRVRFAPSPTGSPHVGNLRTAIYDWLLARKEGGQFITRLEDTDRTAARYIPEGIYDIEASLRFLGILPDEWWVTGGPVGPYVQSQRLSIYREHADRLIESGNGYRCYCSRELLDAMRLEQQRRGEPTGYDRRCRELTEQERALHEEAGEPYVVRLAMPLEGATVLHDLIRGDISFENRLQDDQVLLKSDGFPTYFLGAAVDDHLMGITHILRGDDWLSSAPKFVQVFKALGWEPPLFAHPPLIIGGDRKKLSKRHGAIRFNWFMDQGYLPEALFNFLVLLGWSAGDENRELFTIPELVERFSLEGISQNPAVFDYDKLKWMNGHYIRTSEPGRIIGMGLPYLQKAGLIPPPPDPDASDDDKLKYRIEVLELARRVIPLEQERMKTLAELPDLVSFFFKELTYPDDYDEKGVRKWFASHYLQTLLDREIELFAALPEWSVEALEHTAHALADELGIKLAEVIHPTRMAATGRTAGPGLFETLWALGREKVLTRLRLVREQTAAPAGSESRERQ